MKKLFLIVSLFGLLVPDQLFPAAPAGAAGAGKVDENLLVYTLAGPNGHTNEVNSVAFSPDGSRVVTGSWDNTAKIWGAAKLGHKTKHAGKG